MSRLHATTTTKAWHGWKKGWSICWQKFASAVVNLPVFEKRFRSDCLLSAIAQMSVHLQKSPAVRIRYFLQENHDPDFGDVDSFMKSTIREIIKSRDVEALSRFLQDNFELSLTDMHLRFILEQASSVGGPADDPWTDSTWRMWLK